MSSIVGRFPAEWLTDVSVERPGEPDPRGYPVDAEVHTVGPCLVSQQASAEDEATRSDAAETAGYLFGPPLMDVRSTDVVIVPEGPWPSGRFEVNGEITKGPLGDRARLRRV